MARPLLRVAIIGPESSGKSTLTLALQSRLAHCGVFAVAVAEYARIYYAERAYHPEPHDVLAIAKGQLAAEEAALQLAPEILLCDSTVLTCQIWAEVSFGAAEEQLSALNQPQSYDVTLLACPDLPWFHDRLRSHETGRDGLLARYRAALRQAGVDWVEICGEGGQREQLAWQVLRRKWPFLPKI